MLEAGGHDLVVISDSNVAVAPDYLARMVGQLVSGGRVGVVSSLIAGVGDERVGATLDALHLNGYVAGNVAASQELGDRAVTVGKSMLLRRSVFERLGGLESVATLLAEDYVIGRMFHEAGYRVRLCTEPVRNVTGRMSVWRFVQRHLRWGLLRSRLKPFVYLAEPLANPMAVALGAAAALGAAWPLAWGLGLTLLRDALGWLRLRGAGGLAAALPLGPAKDLLLLGVWAVAPFMRRITWRHTTVRVGAGTRLYAQAPGRLPGVSATEHSAPAGPRPGPARLRR
jgi:ceramide glucosyltransferase